MGSRRWTRCGWRFCALAAAGLLAVVCLPSVAQARFDLGLEDAGFFLTTAGARASMQTLDRLHGTTVRLPVQWSSIAPAGTRAPSGFNAADPADPHYRWGSLDFLVTVAAREHVRLILDVDSAPTWAQGAHRPRSPNIAAGAWDPSPAAFGAFMHAAAVRYDGRYPGPAYLGPTLPRVKYWEIWNEENLPIELAAPNLVQQYRSMLNAAYTSLKGVNGGNVVIAGGLAPVSYIAPYSISPLKFAASLMCLRRTGTRFRRVASCSRPAHFDVFGFHPYSVSATPTKHAYKYDDVLVGDMGKITDVLKAAQKARTVIPRGPKPIWVTEWSWITDPPDKTVGDPDSVAARYVSYSMYEMWRSGVQLVVWLRITDAPGDASYSGIHGGGLFAADGHPKLIFRAFGFPFIASVQRGHGYAWGRAPVSRPVVVVVDRAVGRHWRRVGVTRTRSDGVFSLRFRSKANAVFRARVERGAVSLAYDSRPIPPRRTHLFYSG